MRRKTDPNDLGTISNQLTYPMPVFMKTAGIGKHALTQLRKQGLRVIRTGGRVFIRGQDFFDFLGSMNDADGDLEDNTDS
jgi:hypothetical protein